MITRKTQQGHIAMIALIITLASLALSLGYLHWVLGERVSFLRRLAAERARHNSYDGLARHGYQIAVDPNISSDSLMINLPVSPYMKGLVDSIIVEMRMNPVSNRANHVAVSVGSSFYPSFTGEYVYVRAKTYTAFQAKGFEEFMYFTNEEMPGGGPWLGTSPVVFGSSQILEGRVHSNQSITMYGTGFCPQFMEGSYVTTSGTFIYNGCPENSVFPPDETTHEDSVPKIDWPPFTGVERVKQRATYYYDATVKIHDDPTWTYKDTLIMTEIVFNDGYFTIRHWPYIPPPRAAKNLLNAAAWEDSLDMYATILDANYANGTGYNNTHNFYSFDFFPGDSGFVGPISEVSYFDPEAVIWIEGGQVVVRGTVRGRYTIATSAGTEYRVHGGNAFLTPNPIKLPGNIWITDDLVYADSRSDGSVVEGTPNRIGLLAGGNVIIANTIANGGGHRGTGIKINAAMIAQNESFIVHYWQNSTNAYVFRDPPPNGLVKGDGRGIARMNTSTALDNRGTINIWGSIVQSKRGYVLRNAAGPYNIGGAGSGIGYVKNYHYDYNLLDYPPPYWPETQTENGESLLQMASYGEVVY